MCASLNLRQISSASAHDSGLRLSSMSATRSSPLHALDAGSGLLALQPGIAPRLLRHRDAPAYLGVDRNRFNAEVRPSLTEIPIGRRGWAFDRLELDAWADAYIAARGRPSRKSTKGAVPCELGHQASSVIDPARGRSISSTRRAHLCPAGQGQSRRSRKLAQGAASRKRCQTRRPTTSGL